MDKIEKYGGELVERIPSSFEMPAEPQSESTSALITAILRKWHIAVIVFVVMCVVGISAIWLLVEPRYDVTGAIRVAPILANILTGEADKGEISNYQSFMNTQAEIILSPVVTQRVADDLVGKHLAFFEDQSAGIGAKLRRRIESSKMRPDPANILKQAQYDGIIKAEAVRNSELVKVTMTSNNPEEAKKIVDTFIQDFMLIEFSSSLQGRDQTLTVLENEQKVWAEKLKSQREAIRKEAQEYGTSALDDRQHMMLQRVASLLAELTKADAQRIELETKIQVLQESKVHGLPEEVLNKRDERINADPTIQELTRNIVRLEQDLVAAKQVMTPENPLLKQKEEFIESFKKRIEERRLEVSKDFESTAAEEANEIAKNELLNARSQLEQVTAYEKRLRDVLDKEDAQTVELGRKQLAIEEMKEQLAATKERYDTFGKRIQDLEIERKRPARVSVAYNADVSSIRDKRIKYTVALIFGAVACGLLGAFLRDKADLSLHTPDDVVKRIGIRIIGTTTSPRTVKQVLLAKQMAEDYQTIRANLGLLDGGVIPRKLVVTSPGMRDGKTTFAINLATSLSRSGKKVLLIDGDLRKPDIGRLLNIPRESRCLQDVLSGNKLEEAVFVMASVGLHVLANSSQNLADPYELLASHQAAEHIEELSRGYDHVIIDTPPVLAFPDALLWARMAGFVILTGFADRTTAPDLKETKERLAEMGVKIMGTVLSNVPAYHAYYRYGYHYYAQDGRSPWKDRNSGGRSLLLPTNDAEKTPDESIS